MIPTRDITGWSVSALGLDETVAELASWLDAPAAGGPAPYFACGNPYSFEVARRDTAFGAAIHGARLVCADGVGVLWAARLLRRPLPERVCGPDIFLRLCRRLDGERPGTRMFFLGSSEENLAELAARFRRDFPRLEVAGTLAPPFCTEFSADDDEQMVAAVEAARTDVLWLGLGAPKQEKWARRNAAALRVRLIGPVGAVFDFYTERVQPPPRWMRAFGGYTLFRLLQEPRRVGRRLGRDFRFFARAAREAAGGIFP
ncbi:MAG: WecB/TagA/CpsF family glycosyltransferase [Opitutaceae bacterium]